MWLPFVSVLMPMRDEERYIASCLDSILKNDYPKDHLEILVIDGRSTDRSGEIVRKYANRYPFMRLLDNPKRIVPTALNIGIANAKGQVIMRLDAHNTYPSNYISDLIVWLDKSGADNVGGIWITRPATDTPMAQAIAVGISHPFGVGNAYFRIGASEPRWVDTVPFGCYRREVFDRIGMFDEELVRNQDDEFNHRLIRHGGRILLVPWIVSYYYSRESLVKLSRMYYQYGYLKPLVARKVGRVLTVRQLIPATFILTLLATGIVGLWFPAMQKMLAAIVVSYAAVDLVCSTIVVSKRGVKCGLGVSVVFPVLHLSYGAGFLKGVLDFLILRRNRGREIACIPISR